MPQRVPKVTNQARTLAALSHQHRSYTESGILSQVYQDANRCGHPTGPRAGPYVRSAVNDLKTNGYIEPSGSTSPDGKCKLKNTDKLQRVVEDVDEKYGSDVPADRREYAKRCNAIKERLEPIQKQTKTQLQERLRECTKRINELQRQLVTQAAAATTRPSTSKTSFGEVPDVTAAEASSSPTTPVRRTQLSGHASLPTPVSNPRPGIIQRALSFVGELAVQTPLRMVWPTQDTRPKDESDGFAHADPPASPAPTLPDSALELAYLKRVASENRAELASLRTALADLTQRSTDVGAALAEVERQEAAAARYITQVRDLQARLVALGETNKVLERQLEEDGARYGEHVRALEAEVSRLKDVLKVHADAMLKEAGAV